MPGRKAGQEPFRGTQQGRNGPFLATAIAATAPTRRSVGAAGPRGAYHQREVAFVNLIAWIVLGAIAGYVAGFLVRGDEGLGVIGHIVLGIVGAVLGGFLAGLLLNVKDPLTGPFDLSTVVISVIGAVLVVVLVGFATGTRRVGRGPV
jgi:uncharacterized membrane protein YeaQ/YmgE (transglycosylase-associated protein family)